jgi:hypothetical protein
MITSRTPATWQELQADTAKILTECGFSVEIEKSIESARGSVEIDVYAEEVVRGRRYAIACECKHWKSRIPQTVVHAFRTVVSEIGANIGYLISLEGFQTGSIKASELTNLQLVTWHEFQDLFEESWFESYFTVEVHKRFSPLMTYAEGFLPRWWDQMHDEDQRLYLALLEEYGPFGWLMQRLGPYTRRLRGGPIPQLPLRTGVGSDLDLARIPADITDGTSYREVFEACALHAETALARFRELRDKYNRTAEFNWRQL